MKKYILLFALMLASVAGFAKDIKTVVVTTTPQMHCANCENKIKSNLRFEKGVKKIDTSIPDQTVTIQYDADKTTPVKLLQGFTKFGYSARVVEKGEKVKKNEKEVCDNM
jgi:Cation transport ATPase